MVDRKHFEKMKDAFFCERAMGIVHDVEENEREKLQKEIKEEAKQRDMKVTFRYSSDTKTLYFSKMP